jgi:hypothetical protein
MSVEDGRKAHLPEATIPTGMSWRRGWHAALGWPR